jgi:hypothetical protein
LLATLIFCFVYDCAGIDVEQLASSSQLLQLQAALAAPAATLPK